MFGMSGSQIQCGRISEKYGDMLGCVEIRVGMIVWLLWWCDYKPRTLDGIEDLDSSPQIAK